MSIDKRYSYWWDYDSKYNVIIESTDPKRPVLMRLYNRKGSKYSECDIADEIIKFLNLKN